jgi:chromosome segregation ATPase
MAEDKKASSDVKITEEETKQIRNLQERYTQITVNLGQLSLVLERTKNSLESLESQREELISEHNTSQEEEQKLVEELTGKYGIGNLDLDTGIFTPNG